MKSPTMVRHRRLFFAVFSRSEGPESRHCERSEAIHLEANRSVDCFVAIAPRNDGALI